VAGIAALGLMSSGKPIMEQPTPSHYVVLIVINAARPSYLSLTSLPQIGALIERGVAYDPAWVEGMESSTPAVYATIDTGTQLRQNGFWGFGWVETNTREQVDFRMLLTEGKIHPVL